MAFGPMAFKGFPPPEVCDEEEEEDEEEDDNCTPGWQANECLNDGTVTYARGCSSCDDCEMYDYTAATGGRATCDPTTNTMSYDNGGNDIDVRPFWSGCWYDDCDDDEGSDPTPVESPFLVTGDLTFEGMTYEAARDNTDVFVAAVADLCGVAASAVTVEISEARRRRLAEGIVVTYTVGVATANEAQAVTSAISSSSTADVDAAISKAATDAGVDDDFDGVTTTNVGTPTTTSSGDDGSSGGNGGNGGADAASAGLIAGVVVGVAALAGIAFGAYWFMRAKGGAAEPPMIEVQEMAPAPVPRKDQLYAAAVPVASAPPIMPPPPPEPAQERPSMLSKLASWRAPATEAPTGRNLFCTACGAPVQGPFCGGCGLRAA